ncbi:MAG: toxin-antitoxin system YwqK family antitoxin [Bacteroidia bacterium]
MAGVMLACGFICWTNAAFGQDTILLYGDTIRVGELEWDMQKDWRARGTLITENRELYGDHVRILLKYGRSRTVSEIAFGYLNRQEDFIQHGPARYYYESGRMLGRRTYVEGVQQGWSTDYFPDGKLKAKGLVRDGRLEGPFESYYQNGAREIACHYAHDSLDGLYRAWYSNGQLHRIEHWSLDQKLGQDSIYYEDGKLEAVMPYDADQLHGVLKVFHRNGQPWTERVYEQGRLMDVAYIQSKEGRPLEIGTFHHGEGWVNLYNDKGLLTARERYRDGLLVKSKKAKE